MIDVNNFGGFELRGINMAFPCIVALDNLGRLPLDFNAEIPAKKPAEPLDLLTKEFYRRGAIVVKDSESFYLGGVLYTEVSLNGRRSLMGCQGKGEDKRAVSIYQEDARHAYFHEYDASTGIASSIVYEIAGKGLAFGTDYIPILKTKIRTESIFAVAEKNIRRLFMSAYDRVIVTSIVKDCLDGDPVEIQHLSEDWIEGIGLEENYRSIEYVYMGGLLTSSNIGKSTIQYYVRENEDTKRLTVARSHG